MAPEINIPPGAKCVVVTVDYRLAPEEKYPKAVEDAEEALFWIRNHGKQELGVDLNKFAVGGSSRCVFRLLFCIDIAHDSVSGGNLAAIVSHKAALANPPIPLAFQLLVVPVVDNTATPENSRHKSWQENANTPSLSPAKMLWYRQNYTPNEADWTKWDNSPLFGPDEAFKRAPPTWICVAELDILRDEGIAYAEKLQSFGVPTEVKIYKGAPHPIMAMDGKCIDVLPRCVLSPIIQNCRCPRDWQAACIRRGRGVGQSIRYRVGPVEAPP